MQPDLDCNYAYPIDLTPREIPFGVNLKKSVITLQIWFDLTGFVFRYDPNLFPLEIYLFLQIKNRTATQYELT